MLSNSTNKLDNNNKASKIQLNLSKMSSKREKLFKSRSMYSDFNYNYDYNLWEREQHNKSFDYPQIAAYLQQPSRIYGLLPVEYDGGFVNENASSILGDFYGAENETLATNENFLSNQFSTPIMYILCMMIIYGFIILVVCIYALYSHRKRIGYNYDDSLEHLDGYSSNEEIDEAYSERSEFLAASSNKNENFKKTQIQIDTQYINALGANKDRELKDSSQNFNSAFENSLSDEDADYNVGDEKNFICIEMKPCKNPYEKLATDDAELHENQFSPHLQSINYLDKIFQYIPTKNNYSRVNSNEEEDNFKTMRDQKCLNSSLEARLNDKKSNCNKYGNSALILDVEKIFAENIF
jgi:hypothetical protein